MARSGKRASLLKTFRKIHRITAIWLFLFFFIMALTGLLLGLKKNTGGLIQARSYQGTSTDLNEWLPLEALRQQANTILRDSVSPTASLELDRIDVRQDKGMVKFIFAEGFRAIQLDGATGELLFIESRRSDFIEKIHDGSLVDYYLGTQGDPFKLIYSTTMALALLVFTVTGFWLWYAPRKARRRKAHLH